MYYGQLENRELEENMTNILGTLRADNGDANENVAEKFTKKRDARE